MIETIKTYSCTCDFCNESVLSTNQFSNISYFYDFIRDNGWTYDNRVCRCNKCVEKLHTKKIKVKKDLIMWKYRKLFDEFIEDNVDPHKTAKRLGEIYCVDRDTSMKALKLYRKFKRTGVKCYDL